MAKKGRERALTEDNRDLQGAHEVVHSRFLWTATMSEQGEFENLRKVPNDRYVGPKKGCRTCRAYARKRGGRS
jgi:hypothetical protein